MAASFPATPRAALAPVRAALEAEGAVHLRGVSPGARGWLAAGLCSGDAPLVWVCADEGAAERACRAARFFLGQAGPDTSDPFADPVAHFPLHQTLPYEDLSPDRLTVAERLAVLFRLLQGTPPALLVTSVAALAHLTMPRAALDSASMLILEGQEIDRGRLAAGLVRAGYLNVPLVDDPGSFAIRGGILDLYTPQLPLPVRIELLGDEVESIRTFDPDTQRTVSRLDSVYLGPVREILRDQESSRRALASLDRLTDELDLPSSRLMPARRAIQDGTWFFGIETLLPAFYPALESLLDYLPGDARVLLDAPAELEQAARDLWQRAVEAHERAAAGGNLVYGPARFLLPPGTLLDGLRRRAHVSVGLTEDPAPGTGGQVVEFSTRDVHGLREAIRQAAGGDPLGPLGELLHEWRRLQLRPFVSASRPGRARELAGMLRRRGFPCRLEEVPYDPAWAEQAYGGDPVRIVPGDLPAGFQCKDAGVGFLPDAEVFGHPARRSPARAAVTRAPALKPGQAIVHVDFGIGRFEGLCKLQAGGVEADYLLLAYRDGDRLYLPVTRMDLIEPYLGAGGDAPQLSKLGGKSWERTKQRVHQALLEMADELVRLHAERLARPGLATSPPEESFQALEASFAYEETPDQERAIREVVDDVASPRVMDRLVCGDVGFGKTEVAVRAAFLNALDGRQTAVLVPTTILALQHLDTFRQRLDGHAVRCEMVSRLVKPADQRCVLQDAADGKVDVLIGTHRLLMQDVRFKQLGLLIIDEEHRFGVRHKERLKQLRKNVDVLTMTATPIPRTLQLALGGMRDISVIQTPPPGRRSIRTIITRFSARVIAEAIGRELDRGGQVFFLHNWVRSLPAMERFINRTIPRARTAVAHGQMGERRLEDVMTAFVRREVDVLVCTSIIESGLDIPSANTILVNRADHFGLSQLHQIRGRVGRSPERAYAYLLIPGLDVITADARKRLEVLSDHTEVGAGYRVASHDLEMRGAGNLLGRSQSGHIAAVGFELYNRLLERAVMEVRGQAVSRRTDPEVTLPVAGYLPEGYIAEQEQRLEIYARLSRAGSAEEVFELERELVDRFGPAPAEVVNLCELMVLKILLRQAGIPALEMKGHTLRLTLDTGRDDTLAGLVRLAKQRPARVRLDPQGVLEVDLEEEERLVPLQSAREVVSWAGASAPS